MTSQRGPPHVLDSTLGILLDLDYHRNIDTPNNGVIIGELGEDISKTFEETIKVNLAKIVDESFKFEGNPKLLNERDFFRGAVSSLINNSREDLKMIKWAKERADKFYTSPVMYLYALAIYTKTLAKESGILKQIGLDVYRV